MIEKVQTRPGDYPRSPKRIALNLTPRNLPLSYLITPSAEPVVRLGDLTTLREFRRSALYQECMRPMGVRRELCLTLPLGRVQMDLQNREGGLGALAVHRDGRNFRIANAMHSGGCGHTPFKRTETHGFCRFQIKCH
jgi:hypothetical protein